jgi:orotate phosphoribosyltransferase
MTDPDPITDRAATDRQAVMTDTEVMMIFRACGALRHGHFLLSSGLHSDTYLQCALVMRDARVAESLCAALARKVMARLGASFDMIFSPAMGGVIVGYEMGRQLGAPAVFFEREGGAFTLRRGFQIPPAARCLLVEDVVTTGLSSRECIAAARALGADVVGACALVDRSAGAADVGVPLIALLSLDVATYAPDALPPHLADIPAIKPGSRSLS